MLTNFSALRSNLVALKNSTEQAKPLFIALFDTFTYQRSPDFAPSFFHFLNQNINELTVLACFLIKVIVNLGYCSNFYF